MSEPLLQHFFPHEIMIASILSLLPNIITGVFFMGITWIVTKMWYTSRYIHRSEVKPLQESQHMMQNQYAILAERIKNSEQQLAETKTKLDAAIKEREQALLHLKEMQLKNPGASLNEYQLNGWKDKLLEELKQALASNSVSAIGDDASRFGVKEQFNFLRQSLKEFKTELVQKSNVSTNQYHELSNQLWQLIEVNKKLSIEAEQLNKLFNNSATDDETKLAERSFTLASIKKRS